MDEELSNPLPRFATGQEVATFFASCGILHKAWEEISRASMNHVETFVVNEYEGVVYVTFPSLYTEDFVVKDSKYGECMIQNENTAFSHSLKGNDDQPALVHKGALRLFLRILESSDFNGQMSSFMSLKREQAIVFVGHSLGGAVATLATIWFLGKRIRQISPFCITFGSPLVGDARLGEAIGREDWSGFFFNVVSKYDIVPRMLLAPSESIAQPLTVILPHWGSIMGKASMVVSHPPDQEACKTLLKNVLQHISTIASNYTEESGLRSMYRPFGTYMFCSTHGAVCIGDPEAVLKMLHFTMQCNEGKTFDEIADVCIAEHTDYGNMLEYITEHLLNTITMGIANPISDSSYEMGIALQLEAMGIGAQKDHASLALKKVDGKKGTIEMKIEELNATLSKNQSAMAELEWYKGLCKVKGIGYYDYFKHQNDQKNLRIEMFRISLGTFWDSIVDMVEKHKLPIDIQFQNKWINAGTAYRRLVEPLDIADYYGKQKKLLARCKLLQSPAIQIPYSSLSSARFYHSRRFTFTNEEDQSSSRHSVGIFWDLDNKPPHSVPPYEAAVRLRNLSSQFGLPKTMVVYANRHTFTFLPDWVRAQRRERKALDILEYNGIIRSRDPYVCEVCGRRFETNIKFQKHFRELHEREHRKRLARLESLKGKKKDFFRARIGHKEEKYRAAAREVLMPKEGYGLAGELKRAGFSVRTVRDKPQAADIALENDMMEAIENEIKCLCLVSDDSDFVRVLKKARARNVRTVVVGDVYGDLKIFADANFSWRDVSGGHAWRDDSDLKQAERNYRPKSTKNFEGEEEDDLFESLGSEDDDDNDDFRLEECNDEGFNFKVKECKDERFDFRDKECKYEAFEVKDRILFAPEGGRRSDNQRKVRPWWKLESDGDD